MIRIGTTGVTAPAIALSFAALLVTSQSGAGGPTTSAARRPPPSAGHAIVFHDSLGALLLVNAGLGGSRSPGPSTPTTLWRWADSGWTVIDSGGPPIRNLGGVAYDVARNALVLFGGTYDQSLSYGDTWEWRPETGWRRAADGPGIRDHTAMAYDAERRRVVLFGGQARIDSFPADTWTWDGAEWTRIDAAGPGPRIHHTLAYDPAARQVMLFGGIVPGRGRRGDTWGWTGTEWRRVAPEVAGRSHARLARGPDGMVVFGGIPPGAPPLGLGPAGWEPRPQSGAPLPRYLPALGFDPVRGLLVLFGGGDPASGQLYDDTWVLDRSGWRRVP